MFKEQFIESVVQHIPTEELEVIRDEAESGDYAAARAIVQRELARRAGIVQEMHTVDEPYLVPVDPMDDLQCESCQ